MTQIVSDPQGLQALDTIATQDAFNRWMYQTIAPFCRGEILEVGSGIGNISRFFLEAGQRLSLSDLRSEYLARLQQRFAGQIEPERIFALDLVAPDFERRYARWQGHFDSLFALNVLEHIADQDLALCHAASLLKPGGQMVMLVPAYFLFYNHFDRNLGHYRRYTRPTLRRALQRAGLAVYTDFYFNLAGLPGWWISGKLQAHQEIPGAQMALFNRCVPLLKHLDTLSGRRFGLSVVGVARKRSAP